MKQGKSIIICLAAIFCIMISSPALMAEQKGEAQPAESTKTESVEKVARELANPLAPITTFVSQFRVELGSGPDDDTNYQLRLQPSFFKPFADQSAFLLRTIVPLRFNKWPTNDSGLGDITLTPYYVPDVTHSTFLGFGGTFTIPTATKEPLGSGKWSAGPALLLAQVGQPITWGGLVQHIWSFAGQSDRSSISVSTVQPFITYLLGNGWAATLTSETTYNWQADGNEKWTVPIGAQIAKVLQIGGNFFNFGLAGVYYAERPAYAPEWEARFSVTYVFK
jgi:hypothetical protein